MTQKEDHATVVTLFCRKAPKSTLGRVISTNFARETEYLCVE